MENFSTCKTCKTEFIIIENKLFYTEDEQNQNIYCPICQDIFEEKSTDGWFFIQTKQQFLKDQENANLLTLIHPMP